MNWKPLVMGGAALAGLNHLMNRPGNRAVGDLDDGVVEMDNFYSVEKLIYRRNQERHGYDGPDNAHVGDFVVLAHFHSDLPGIELIKVISADDDSAFRSYDLLRALVTAQTHIPAQADDPYLSPSNMLKAIEIRQILPPSWAYEQSISTDWRDFYRPADDPVAPGQLWGVSQWAPGRCPTIRAYWFDYDPEASYYRNLVEVYLTRRVLGYAFEVDPGYESLASVGRGDGELTDIPHRELSLETSTAVATNNLASLVQNWPSDCRQAATDFLHRAGFTDLNLSEFSVNGATQFAAATLATALGFRRSEFLRPVTAEADGLGLLNRIRRYRRYACIIHSEGLTTHQPWLGYDWPINFHSIWSVYRETSTYCGLFESYQVNTEEMWVGVSNWLQQEGIVGAWMGKAYLICQGVYPAVFPPATHPLRSGMLLGANDWTRSRPEWDTPPIDGWGVVNPVGQDHIGDLGYRNGWTFGVGSSPTRLAQLPASTHGHPTQIRRDLLEEGLSVPIVWADTEREIHTDTGLPFLELDQEPPQRWQDEGYTITLSDQAGRLLYAVSADFEDVDTPSSAVEGVDLWGDYVRRNRPQYARIRRDLLEDFRSQPEFLQWAGRVPIVWANTEEAVNLLYGPIRSDPTFHNLEAAPPQRWQDEGYTITLANEDGRILYAVSDDFEEGEGGGSPSIESPASPDPRLQPQVDESRPFAEEAADPFERVRGEYDVEDTRPVSEQEMEDILADLESVGIDLTSTRRDDDDDENLSGVVAGTFEVKANFPEADFWLGRVQSVDKLGHPQREFNPNSIGVKVLDTDRWLPDYLYYQMLHIWQQGYWRQVGRGTAQQSIRVTDVEDVLRHLAQQMDYADHLREIQATLEPNIRQYGILMVKEPAGLTEEEFMARVSALDMEAAEVIRPPADQDLSDLTRTIFWLEEEHDAYLLALIPTLDDDGQIQAWGFLPLNPDRFSD